jgi:hypothetical protein
MIKTWLLITGPFLVLGQMGIVQPSGEDVCSCLRTTNLVFRETGFPPGSRGTEAF